MGLWCVTMQCIDTKCFHYGIMICYYAMHWYKMFSLWDYDVLLCNALILNVFIMGLWYATMQCIDTKCFHYGIMICYYAMHWYKMFSLWDYDMLLCNALIQNVFIMGLWYVTMQCIDTKCFHYGIMICYYAMHWYKMFSLWDYDMLLCNALIQNVFIMGLWCVTMQCIDTKCFHYGIMICYYAMHWYKMFSLWDYDVLLCNALIQNVFIMGLWYVTMQCIDTKCFHYGIMICYYAMHWY